MKSTKLTSPTLVPPKIIAAASRTFPHIPHGMRLRWQECWWIESLSRKVIGILWTKNGLESITIRFMAFELKEERPVSLWCSLNGTLKYPSASSDIDDLWDSFRPFPKNWSKLLDALIFLLAMGLFFWWRNWLLLSYNNSCHFWFLSGLAIGNYRSIVIVLFLLDGG